MPPASMMPSEKQWAMVSSGESLSKSARPPVLCSQRGAMPMSGRACETELTDMREASIDDEVCRLAQPAD